MSRFQKGKTNLDLLEIVSGSGISWAICKSAPRPRQITMPTSHYSAFYRPDALPAVQPTASKHWRQYKTYTYAETHTQCHTHTHTYMHSQSSSACVVEKITNHYKCCENQNKITSIGSAVFACCRANKCVQHRPGHTVRPRYVKTVYTHGLLIESPFVPSSTERWAVRAKIRQKRPSRCKLCSEKVVEARKRERWKLWLV